MGLTTSYTRFLCTPLHAYTHPYTYRFYFRPYYDNWQAAAGGRAKITFGSTAQSGTASSSQVHKQRVNAGWDGDDATSASWTSARVCQSGPTAPSSPMSSHVVHGVCFVCARPPVRHGVSRIVGRDVENAQDCSRLSTQPDPPDFEARYNILGEKKKSTPSSFD